MSSQLDTWASSVLRGIGAPLTQANVSFLEGWAQREGVPQSVDHFNYLGTTLKVGSSYGTNDPGKAFGEAAGVIPGVSEAESVAKFLGRLTDPSFILRGLQIVGGAGMVAVGMVLLAKQVALGGTDVAPGPVLAAAAAVA